MEGWNTKLLNMKKLNIDLDKFVILASVIISMLIAMYLSPERLCAIAVIGIIILFICYIVIDVT